MALLRNDFAREHFARHALEHSLHGHKKRVHDRVFHTHLLLRDKSEFWVLGIGLGKSQRLVVAAQRHIRTGNNGVFFVFRLVVYFEIVLVFVRPLVKEIPLLQAAVGLGNHLGEKVTAGQTFEVCPSDKRTFLNRRSLSEQLVLRRARIAQDPQDTAIQPRSREGHNINSADCG